MPSGSLINLRHARDLADRCYAEPLDLAALAGAAGMSRSHFVRAFAKAYGQTPMRYVTQRRIDRAQDLLRSANLTVTEIAMMVGFNSLGSFTSRFTTLVGVSPTIYRDRWAASGGNHIPGCFLFMRGLDPWPGPGKSGPRKSGPGKSGQSNLGEARGRTPSYDERMITNVSLATVWVIVLADSSWLIRLVGQGGIRTFAPMV